MAKPLVVDFGNGITVYGELAARILTVLRDHGPMTRAELEKDPQIRGKVIGRRITYLRTISPMCPVKRVHISGWKRAVSGRRTYPRAVYAFGPGDDAPNPWAGEDRQVQIDRAHRRYLDKCKREARQLKVERDAAQAAARANCGRRDPMVAALFGAAEV